MDELCGRRTESSITPRCHRLPSKCNNDQLIAMRGTQCEPWIAAFACPMRRAPCATPKDGRAIKWSDKSVLLGKRAIEKSKSMTQRGRRWNERLSERLLPFYMTKPERHVAGLCL